MDRPGIYQLTNTVNGKFYIGQSGNVELRQSQHFRSLRSGKHSSPILQRAFNKHGEDAFVFTVLLYCELYELTRYEQALTDRRCPEYAIRLDCVDSNRGIRHSEQTRANMRKAQKGKVISQEAIEKMKRTKRANPRKMSDEEKELRRVWSTGYRHSEETKASMSEALMGHTFSQETREKISNTLLGNTPWNKGKHTGQIVWNKGKKTGPRPKEHCERISKGLMGHAGWNKGKVLSPEAKQRMSVAQQARREKERIERATL